MNFFQAVSKVPLYVYQISDVYLITCQTKKIIHPFKKTLFSSFQNSEKESLWCSEVSEGFVNLHLSRFKVILHGYHITVRCLNTLPTKRPKLRTKNSCQATRVASTKIKAERLWVNIFIFSYRSTSSDARVGK